MTGYKVYKEQYHWLMMYKTNWGLHSHILLAMHFTYQTIMKRTYKRFLKRNPPNVGILADKYTDKESTFHNIATIHTTIPISSSGYWYCANYIVCSRWVCREVRTGRIYIIGTHVYYILLVYHVNALCSRVICRHCLLSFRLLRKPRADIQIPLSKFGAPSGRGRTFTSAHAWAYAALLWITWQLSLRWKASANDQTSVRRIRISASV